MTTISLTQPTTNNKYTGTASGILPVQKSTALSGYSVGTGTTKGLPVANPIAGGAPVQPTQQGTTLVQTPTTVVSSNTATNKVKQINQTMTDAQAKIDAQKQVVNNPDQRDANGLLINPPGALFDRNTGKPLGGSTTTTSETKLPTPEEKLANLPAEGMQKVYSTYTGQESEIPIGTIPSGMSSQNPTTRTDVSSSVVDESGNTIKKFSDGTYGNFDPQGNYSASSEFAFTNTQRIQTTLDNLDKAVNGTYPLTDAQNGQIQALKDKYGTLIKQQQVINANTEGGTTIAVNRWGIGDQLVGSGIIDQVVKDGIDKITNLQNLMAAGVTDMRSAFDKQNIDALKTAYDSFSASQIKLQENLTHIQTVVENAKKAQDTKNDTYFYQQLAAHPDADLLVTDTPAEIAEKVTKSESWKNKQTSNEVDPVALQGMIAVYKATGAPPTGLYSKVLKEAFYSAIGGDTSMIGIAMGNKAALASAQTALNTQTNMFAGSQTSIGTLDKTLELAQTYSNKVDRTGSPFFAHYAMYLKGQVAGDADTAAFQNLMMTASTEYAKIMSGAASSISGVTVTSAEDAKLMLNSAMSKGQIDEVMKVMKMDAHFRLSSQQETIKNIKQDIQDMSTSATSGTGATPTGNDLWNF